MATLWKNVVKRNMIFESSTNARNIHVNTKIKNDRCKILYWNTSHVSIFFKKVCIRKIDAISKSQMIKELFSVVSKQNCATF